MLCYLHYQYRIILFYSCSLKSVSNFLFFSFSFQVRISLDYDFFIARRTENLVWRPVKSTEEGD